MARGGHKFFRLRDGDLLARERHGDTFQPEVFHEGRGWTSQTFDVYHDATPIGADEALTMMPAGSSMGDLQSTGDTGNFGDIYEGERAPLRS